MVRMNNPIAQPIEAVVEDDISLWTETSTRIIHDVRFFGEFMLVRPCSTEFHSGLRRLDANEFFQEFTEYYGPQADIRDYIRALRT